MWQSSLCLLLESWCFLCFRSEQRLMPPSQPQSKGCCAAIDSSSHELARVDLLQSHYCNFWLMYVWLGDFCVSNGSPTVLLTQIMQILRNRVFFKSQNSRKPGTLCISCFAWLYADLSRNPKCDTQCITIELRALTCITNWEINFLPALRQQ